MKKNLLEIYALAVCFCIIMSFAIHIVVGICDVVEFNAPAFTMSSAVFAKHQTNEEFTSYWKEERRERLTEEQITKLREESYQVALENVQRSAMQSLLRVLISITISIVVFLIHWAMAKKARVLPLANA